MEPLLELSTIISPQVWFLHEHYPNKDSLSAILNEDWSIPILDEAALDWSRVQILLDFAGQTEETNWNEEDPFPGIELKSETSITSETWRDVLLRKWRKRRERLDRLAEVRFKAATRAVEVLKQRVEAIKKARLDQAIQFSNVEENWGTPIGSQRRNNLHKVSTPDDLVRRVARWLFVAPLDVRHSLAQSFLNGKSFEMQDEIDRRASEIIGTSKFRIFGSKPAIETSSEAWNEKSANDKMLEVLDRSKLREWCWNLDVPVPFSMVLSDELDEISSLRASRFQVNRQNKDASGEQVGDNSIPPDDAAFSACLCGLALSGGGIRSATFGLGLLQGMADHNILPYIDVLSTVSGGGYIGSWLVSWIKRRGSVESVQQSLQGSASSLNSVLPAPSPSKAVRYNSDPLAEEVRPVRLLREYARYLAPQAGLYSVDSWTIGTTWIRNTLLNFMVLLPLFLVILLIPRVVLTLFVNLRVWTSLTSQLGGGIDYWNSTFFKALTGGIPLLFACWYIGSKNLSTFGPYDPRVFSSGVSRGENDARIFACIVTSIFVAAFWELTVIWHSLWYGHDRTAAAIGFSTVVALGLGILIRYTKQWKDTSARRSLQYLIIVGTICICIGLAALLLYIFHRLLEILLNNTARGEYLVVSAGLSMMVWIIGVIVVAFVGLSGKQLSDEQREWWSRLGACLGIATIGWLILCSICFFVPLWLTNLTLTLAAIGAGSWVAITVAGLKLAFSSKTNIDEGQAAPGVVTRAILAIAPAVFVVGILSVLASLIFFALPWVASFVNSKESAFLGIADRQIVVPLSISDISNHYWLMLAPDSVTPAILMLVSAITCFYLAWRIDINEFSMHHFYKNRLVRAYLGASRSRSHRFPNAFTGFDLEDDIRLARLQSRDTTQTRDMARDCKVGYSGPFPILNTALNITKGEDLGLQERRAESFAFTPLRSGFDFSRRQTARKKTSVSEYGFKRTDQFGEPLNKGCLLGTAMAISGAAVSSSAGFHTSPSLSFLLTIFGARLGWWAGNPRKVSWNRSSPELGLLYLVNELTANISTHEDFILLSDGGHFENMGLYELIRRKCRFIILSDAEEDEKFKLEGIGGAVRKCRDDFGVAIDLDLDALRPIGDPANSQLHYSLGEVIYPGESTSGLLVYIKASLTGDESVDIVEFRKRHPEYPHTSTSNQFFDESHFESYRALGQHIASSVFTYHMPPLPLPPNGNPCDAVSQLFRHVEEHWKEQMKIVRSKRSMLAPL